MIGGENYFIEMAYFSDTSLVVRAMPRLQNQWTLVAVDTVTGATRNIRTQQHDQWLEPSGIHTHPSVHSIIPIDHWLLCPMCHIYRYVNLFG